MFLKAQEGGIIQFIRTDSQSLPKDSIFEENDLIIPEIYYMLDNDNNIVIDYDRTWEDYIERAIKYINNERDYKVKNLEVNVTINDTEFTFDADEVSQSRILRAIQTFEEGETFYWIDANNNYVEVNTSIMKEVLKACKEAQYNLWVYYYQIKSKVRSRKTIEQAIEEYEQEQQNENQ